MLGLYVVRSDGGFDVGLGLYVVRSEECFIDTACNECHE